MKKVLLLMMMVFVTSFSFAEETTEKPQGITWENGTLAQAQAKAKTEGKYLFLDCFTSWCPPCKHMTNVEFVTKAAGDYFNNKFVNIAIDMEKGEGVDIAKKYKVRNYPTFIIFSPDGEVLGRVIGGDQIGNFINKVEAVVNK